MPRKPDPDENNEDPKDRKKSRDEDELQLDPLIDALLEHLPAPGDTFPAEARKRWLHICEESFKLIYEDDEEEEEPEEEHGSTGS